MKEALLFIKGLKIHLILSAAKQTPETALTFAFYEWQSIQNKLGSALLQCSFTMC